MTLVADDLRRAFASLTASEQRIARVILSDYPAAGLESAARLARRAASSAPTVVRMMTKLGYAGYPDFQDRLRGELAERVLSPLDHAVTMSADGPVPHSGQVLSQALTSTLARLPASRLSEAANCLVSARDRVTIGGRYSTLLADYLALHLQLLLSRVRQVPQGAMGRTAALLDVSPRSCVVAFDFRRYQDDTVRFCRQARSQGARLILFTDPWLSPAADFADVLVTCRVDSDCMFDSLTAAMGATEAMIATLTELLGDTARARIAQFEGQQPP